MSRGLYAACTRPTKVRVCHPRGCLQEVHAGGLLRRRCNISVRYSALDSLNAERSALSYSEDSSNEALIPAHTSASYDKRVLGAIIDFLIVVAVGIVPVVVFFIAVLSGLAGPGADFGGEAARKMMQFGVISGLAWLVWMPWLFGYRQGVTGKTPGKRHAGTRLTKIGTGEAPGGGIGVGRILVPWLIVVGTVGLGAAYVIIDYLWLLWDDDNQRLTDKMFKTQVVVSTH